MLISVPGDRRSGSGKEFPLSVSLEAHYSRQAVSVRDSI
jgi:hypothetical protein